MHRLSSEWQVKRPLFVSGFIAVTVTAIALKASLAVTLGCVVPLIILLFWKRLWLCATIALCFLLLAVGYRHVYVLPTAPLDGRIDVIEGKVLALPNYGRMYTVEVTHSRYLPSGSRVMLYCPDDQSLSQDDTITAQVELLTITDSQIYYASHLAFVCAFPLDGEGHLQVTGPAAPRTSVIEQVRRALVGVPRTTLPTQESGLLSALCFGETAFLSDSVSAAFRGSGLGHILVVSGLHLSIMALTIQQLLRRFGRYPCCILTLCAVWMFALFVGATPSILRAAVMLSLWLVGRMLFLRSDGLNTLGLAAILLLAINPYAVWDVGFQLSFAATLGVLLLTRRIAPPQDPIDKDLPWYQRMWQRMYRALISVVAVSASALLFTLPIACYHHGGFPLTALPANILATPLAGVTMLMGWLGALCGLIPFMGWLSNGLLLIAGLLIRYIANVATRLSSPQTWVTVGQWWQWLLLTAACALLTAGILCRVPRRRIVTVLLTLTVLTCGVGLPFTAAPPRLTVVPVDNEAGLILQQGTHCALIITDLRDINEVVYDTPAFDPDIVLVLGGDASAITQMKRWPQADIVIATPAIWIVGTDIPFSALPVGGQIALWDDCRLTRLSDGWTQLEMGDDTVCIGTDAQQPCPHPQGWRIYVGSAPATPPDIPYAIVCNDTWLRRHHTALTGRETVIYNDYVTFTPQQGEWRRWLWQ